MGPEKGKLTRLKGGAIKTSLMCDGFVLVDRGGVVKNSD